VSGTERTIGSLDRSSQALEYSVSKLDLTTPLKSPGGVFAHVNERVHRALEAVLARFDIGKLLSRDVHGKQRIEIDIGIHANSVSFLFGHGILCMCRKRHSGKKGDADCQSKSMCTHNALRYSMLRSNVALGCAGPNQEIMSKSGDMRRGDRRGAP